MRGLGAGIQHRPCEPPLPFRDGSVPLRARVRPGLSGLRPRGGTEGPKAPGWARPGEGEARPGRAGGRAQPRPRSCCCAREKPRRVSPLEFLFFLLLGVFFLRGFNPLPEGFVPPPAGPGAFLQPRPLRGKRESKNNRALNAEPERLVLAESPSDRTLLGTLHSQRGEGTANLGCSEHPKRARRPCGVCGTARPQHRPQGPCPPVPSPARPHGPAAAAKQKQK